MQHCVWHSCRLPASHSPALAGPRFGFNNGQTGMDGLYARGSAYHSDYMWVIYQLQLLGFNAIRVPYLFK